jgi:D-glycero-alpha-D-manno-heptose-7-phosphate kinase
MIITRTPFRISFFGGGTDYPVWYKKMGGAVISTSIDKYCYVTTRHLPPFFDHSYRIRYSRREEKNSIAEIEHPSVRECLKYVGFQGGLEMVHTSDLPAMSGLGSSSAFTVGFLHSLYSLTGQNIDKKNLALHAIHVEQKRIKENVGSQDQVAAAVGGFNSITFDSRGIHVSPIAISDSRLHDLESRLLLFFTGFSRIASEIASEQIKNTPKKVTELKAMMALAEKAKGVLSSKSTLDDFGMLLDKSWQLKRSLSSKISTPFIDEAYVAAKSAGALGGKLLGAGGGGFMVFYAPPNKHAAIKRRLKHMLHVPFKFENGGTQIIYKNV